MRLKTWIDQFSNRTVLERTVFCAGLLVLMILFDVITGKDLSFSLFYVVPIALFAWSGGRRAGMAMVVVAAAGWFCADRLSGRVYEYAPIAYWNACIRAGFFALVVVLLDELKRALHREAELSRTDHLTGVANNRSFYEDLEREFKRSVRYGHPLTVAYIDCDDFKMVNDRLGHTAGDRLLRVVGETLKRQVRSVDEVARLGGDEFALILPELDSEHAGEVGEKLRSALRSAMEASEWPVTFSVGLITFRRPPASVDALVHQADQLMYEAKRLGKDRVEHRTV